MIRVFSLALLILADAGTEGEVLRIIPRNEKRPPTAEEPKTEELETEEPKTEEPKTEEPDHRPPLLTLATALERAREKNLDLRIGREALAKASYLSRKAWGVLMPRVDVSLGVTYFDKTVELSFDEFLEGFQEQLEPLGFDIAAPEPILIQRQDRFDASGQFEWVLFNGRAVPLLLSAYDTVEIAQLRYRQHEEMLLAATTLAYFNTVAAERQVELRRRALETAREFSALARARVEIGEALEVEALRSETEVATEEQTLVRLENLEQLAKLALAILAGDVNREGDFAPFRTERPEPSDFDERPPGKSLLDRAFLERLDLRQQRIELVIAGRQKVDTWLRFAPALVATGNYAWSNVMGFSNDAINWRLGFSVRWNIFEGGLAYWELQERQRDINMAALALEKTRKDIARQIREARLNLASSRANLQAAKKRVELARRTAEMVRSQYEVGLATQLELLDANRTRADAETAQTLAQLEVDVSRVSLEWVIRVPPRE